MKETMPLTLADGLLALGLSLDDNCTAQLGAYLELLQKWNRTYNLTAIREPQQMLTHHLLDSLAVLPHVDCRWLADIGSGGGLPGIPLAIARPQMRVALVEAGHKKTAFLTQAKIELGLPNLVVHQNRVENWVHEVRFDGIISRAFSDLAEFVRLSQHLLADGGRFYAMKGVHPHEEIAQLPKGFVVEKVIELQVPGVEGARHLVIVQRG